MTRRNRISAAKCSIDHVRQNLSVQHLRAGVLLQRLNTVRPLHPGHCILDVGAAQGSFLIALAQLGFGAFGVEPYEPAVEIAKRLSLETGAAIEVRVGAAEKIPFQSNSFDAVFANSVMEHVADVRMSFDEIYRVLKPDGVFWFSSVSSLCPFQDEISGFPFFGWYPWSLKRKIMTWAKNNKPELIGFTETPAFNWFTPWNTRRMLGVAGFSRVFDRWDLRQPSEGRGIYRMLLGLAKRNILLKTCADIIQTGCSYAAVK